MSALADFATAAPAQRLSDTPDYRRIFEAVTALRAVNTFSRQYVRSEGRYAEFQQILPSTAVAEFLNRNFPGNDHFAAFARSAQPGARELLNGWFWDFKATNGGSGYVARLMPAPSEEDVANGELPIVATDHLGVIQIGAPAKTASFSAALRATELVNGHAIRVHGEAEPGRFSSIVKRVAMGVSTPVHALETCEPCCSWTAYCCCEFPCFCNIYAGCRCQDTGEINCGCECCVWCYCP